jgi:SAM-dependent methyltransferase
MGAMPVSNHDPKRAWSADIAKEVGFWERWMASRGSEWPEEYRARFDPETPLRVKEHLEGCTADPIEILDVGAGPVTNLGYRWDGHTVRITAVDPLADSYDRLMEKYGATPPVRTTWCQGERLTDRFRADSFDLVHASNSLDNGYDPLRSIEEMLRVAKPGRYVLLRHILNDAEGEGYSSVHQWNFCERAGAFTIWSKSTTIDASRALAPYAQIRCYSNPTHVFVDLKKTASPPERRPSLGGRIAPLLDRFPRVKARLAGLLNR